MKTQQRSKRVTSKSNLSDFREEVVSSGRVDTGLYRLLDINEKAGGDEG